MADDIRTWWAPGRANLLGEHLDYNGGRTLSCAVQQGIRVKARLREDRQVRAWTELDGRRSTAFELGASATEVSGWSAYIAGVAAALTAHGLDRGVDLVYDTDLPVGAGLSSSGAFATVTALALNDLAGLDLGPGELALVVQAAERDYAGAPTGLLDPLTILHARAGHLVHLDFAPSTPSVETVATDWEDDGLSLVTVDTRSSRSLNDGRYAERREQCGQARAESGVEHLAALDLTGVVTLGDETAKARARHVFTEQARVRAGMTALDDRDWSKLGTLLDASQASLADDFAVSSAPLDLACETARESGALGAKLSGAGFGGSIVAVIDTERVESLRGALAQRFEAVGWEHPQVFVVSPADGAREITRR